MPGATLDPACAPRNAPRRDAPGSVTLCVGRALDARFQPPGLRPAETLPGKGGEGWGGPARGLRRLGRPSEPVIEASLA